MTTVEMLMGEREHLEKVVASATAFLREAPDGEVAICGDMYYLKLDGKSTYLSKRRDGQLLRALLQKQYERKAIKAAMEQMAVIERFLVEYNPNALTDIVGMSDPRRSEMITMHESFSKSTPEASSEMDPEAGAGVDLARNLIAICEAFLQSKGGSL